MLRQHPLDQGPYVVKPAKGTGSGDGVSVGVRSRLDLSNALALAALHSRGNIVEQLLAHAKLLSGGRDGRTAVPRCGGP